MFIWMSKFRSKHSKSYFREAEHACGFDEKELILMNLGPIKNETHLNSMQI